VTDLSLPPAQTDSQSQSPLPQGLTPPTQANGFQRRLGDVIVDLGFASREQVEAAVIRARNEGQPTGRVLVDSGVLDTRQLARALAERNGLDYVDLNIFSIDKGAANLVTASEARRLWAIPIAFLDEHTILAATSEPANVVGIDNLSMMTGYDIRLAVGAPEDIEALITQLNRLSESVQEIADEGEEEDLGEPIALRESAEQAPVIKLAHSIIADAVDRGASDIHLEPLRGGARVRYRIDGVATDSTTVPKRHAAGLVSRIKIMAELDIAERRIPQDGRAAVNVDGRPIDMRIATLPVVRGESVVIRILDKGNVVMELDRLGMAPHELGLLQRSLGAMRGAVLTTGPTGAGKTTTLYAALSQVNTPDRTLITIEDPVEYELEGVKQVQVNGKAGLTFANGLRSMIRSDPDVLMVGEIRDPETAQIAIESALTGHLVLSTLHTNEASIAPARLIDMGIEPFLVASALTCVVAQRLARRLCPDCRTPMEITAEELERSGFEPPWAGFEAYRPVGCVRCSGTGYRGRVGLYEVMTTSEEIQSMILRKASADEIGAAAAASGLRGLKVDGLEKVRQGMTSLPEVLRAVGT
jgi:type IV pilus assembly protein PilB